MTAWSDLPDGMRGSTLDEDTIERLLSARVAPDDAPPGYSEIARVVRLVAEHEDPSDRALEERHVAAAIALIRRGSAATAPVGGAQKTRSWRRRARVAGLVFAGSLIGSSGLAFAGALPDPAQDAFAGVLERVGITVPAGNAPDLPDLRDLPDHPASTGEEISDIATSRDASGVDKGAAVSAVASGGRSRAGEEGGPAAKGDGPPVETPNAGGTPTGDAASGSASEAGTDRADERSDGKSAAGSSNGSNATGGSSAGSPSAASGRSNR